jgi:hypothetical protein
MPLIANTGTGIGFWGIRNAASLLQSHTKAWAPAGVATIRASTYRLRVDLLRGRIRRLERKLQLSCH